MSQVVVPEPQTAHQDTPFEALREILLKDDRQQINQVDHRLGKVEFRLDDAETRTAELAEVLSEALNVASKEPRFARVLAPTIEKALFESVRASPEGLADALFPVLMPTIRRVVLGLLERTFENFNRVLDVSVSPRSFAWRLESWRTGKPFAEIVLYHTVQYRVEQVLLIHRETGLLLEHVGMAGGEADLVSAMLTAIQDFARDSFQMGNETIRTFKIGDLTVLVETAPHATLAAAVRGTPPAEIADSLAIALETIELRFAADLTDFVGDTSAFEAAKPILETCLTTVYLHQDKKPTPPAKRNWWLPVGAMVLLAAAFWWGVQFYQQQKWNQAVAALRREPGYLLFEQSLNSVVGLRDPLSRDPQIVLSALGYPDAKQVWGFYQALDASLIVQRAKAALEPASSTQIALQSSTLVFSGEATEAWVKRAKLIARGISGVTGVDSTKVQFVEAEKK